MEHFMSGPGDYSGGVSGEEKDPDGKDQHEPGSKLDQDKIDMSLLLDFSRALKEVAKVGTIGAKKYSRGGWQSVSEGETRYTAAMLRHLFDEPVETFDKDTGMYHAAQVAWNALARLEFLLRQECPHSSSDTRAREEGANKLITSSDVCVGVGPSAGDAYRHVL